MAKAQNTTGTVIYAAERFATRKASADKPARQSGRKCKLDADLPFGLTRDDLPFVKKTKGGLCHWAAKPSGDYQAELQRAPNMRASSCRGLEPGTR
jgi:hypothetical protein